MMNWDPFREMEDLRREIDRAFEGFATGRALDARRAAFLPGYGARRYPLVNLYEDNDNVVVEALAPGINPQTLDLSVQGTTLTISGEKPASGEKAPEAYHRCERSAGKFVRTVTLPHAVDDSVVSATYKHGLLLVTLPKHESAKPKQISVTVG
jgi:HSP20 family protein